MKKRFAIFSTVIIGLLALFLNNCHKPVPVTIQETAENETEWMPDATLRQVVREALELAPDALLTPQMLARLTKLELINLGKSDSAKQKIGSLTGLAHATGLKVLRLYEHHVKDITPLTDLTQLEWLDLYDNEISDLTPLASLTELKRLHLGSNKIKDITPLLPLTGLKELHLSSNRNITDFTPLSSLTGLKVLSLYYNKIVDLAPLANLTELKTLSLRKNAITDLTPLSSLTGLKELSFPDNEVIDLVPLANLTELAQLSLGNNEISDLTSLANLTELRILRLSDNEISMLTPLANLTELRQLDLAQNEINDMGPVANLKRLQELALETNQISDISALAQLTNLQKLQIQPNPIQDLTPLQTFLKSNPEMVIDVGFIGKSLCPVMYWIDMEKGTLHRCVGNTVVNIFPGLQNATSHVLSHHDYYWTEKTGDTTWQIRHASKDRTTARILNFYEELTGIPTAMMIVEGPLYDLYVPMASGKIQRLSEYGFDFDPDFITDLASPKHLVADVLDEKLYWTEKTTDGIWQIRCAALDGSNVQPVRILPRMPLGLGIDSIAKQLYVSVAAGKIQRLRVDGSDFDPDFITGLGSPGSIAVDVEGGMLYWTAKDSIWGASLSGENVACVATGLGMSAHLVLDISLPVAANAR